MAQEKTTFGATIVKPNLAPEHDDPPSRSSTPPACLRTPSAQPESSARRDLSPGDLERGLGGLSQTTTAANSSSANVNRTGDDGRLKECTQWPTKQSLKQKARLAKNKRQCCPWWAGLTKKQKLIFKIVIALIFVGVVTAVAVGISRAVGGGVWSDDGTDEIPN
jgi:hypothetical protein